MAELDDLGKKKAMNFRNLIADKTFKDILEVEISKLLNETDIKKQLTSVFHMHLIISFSGYNVNGYSRDKIKNLINTFASLEDEFMRICGEFRNIEFRNFLNKVNLFEDRNIPDLFLFSRSDYESVENVFKNQFYRMRNTSNVDLVSLNEGQIKRIIQLLNKKIESNFQNILSNNKNLRDFIHMKKNLKFNNFKDVLKILENLNYFKNPLSNNLEKYIKNLDGLDFDIWNKNNLSIYHLKNRSSSKSIDGNQPEKNEIKKKRKLFGFGDKLRILGFSALLSFVGGHPTTLNQADKEISSSSPPIAQSIPEEQVSTDILTPDTSEGINEESSVLSNSQIIVYSENGTSNQVDSKKIGEVSISYNGDIVYESTRHDHSDSREYNPNHIDKFVAHIGEKNNIMSLYFDEDRSDFNLEMKISTDKSSGVSNYTFVIKDFPEDQKVNSEEQNPRISIDENTPISKKTIEDNSNNIHQSSINTVMQNVNIGRLDLYFDGLEVKDIISIINLIVGEYKNGTILENIDNEILTAVVSGIFSKESAFGTSDDFIKLANNQNVNGEFFYIQMREWAINKLLPVVNKRLHSNLNIKNIQGDPKLEIIYGTALILEYFNNYHIKNTIDGEQIEEVIKILFMDYNGGIRYVKEYMKDKNMDDIPPKLKDYVVDSMEFYRNFVKDSNQ